MNFITFNFAHLPRVYIVCLGFKLFRIRKAKSQLLLLLKFLQVGVDKRGLVITLWTMFLLLHLIACFWGAIETFNVSSDQNWIVETNLQDSSHIEVYITALYFAAEILMTVGYGDILPQNKWETVFTCFVLIIGVAMFSYTLSSIGSQFSELNRSVSKRQSRDRQITELKNKYGLGTHLLAKISYYFSHGESILSISQDYEISKILKVLPPFLKTNLALFLYQDAIREIPFLQNRDQMFYLNYLDRLIPLKFKADTVILKEETKPEEVIFILSGEVINLQTQRIFGIGGMLGETDIIHNKRVFLII